MIDLDKVNGKRFFLKVTGKNHHKNLKVIFIAAAARIHSAVIIIMITHKTYGLLVDDSKNGKCYEIHLKFTS